jgi:hypothetical protein
MCLRKAHFEARSVNFLRQVIEIASWDRGAPAVAWSVFSNYLNETRSEPVNPLERMYGRRTGPWLRCY